MKNKLLSLLLIAFFSQHVFGQKIEFCDYYQTSLCDFQGGKITEYDSVYANYSNEYTAFVQKNNLVGILGFETGKELVPCQYEKIYPCKNLENIVLIENRKEQFFCDIFSQKQISPVFKSLVAFIDGNMAYIGLNEPFAVRVNSKCGSMTIFGKTIIPFEYDNFVASKMGYNKVNIVQKGKDYFLLDSIGNRINSKNYTDILGFWDEKHIIAYNKNGVVFLDEQGNEFEKPGESELTFQKFQKADSLVLVNPKGKIINKKSYDFYDFSEWKGYFIVKNSGKKGVIDSDGKEIIPLIYDYIYEERSSSEIRFELKLNGKVGKCGLDGEVKWE